MCLRPVSMQGCWTIKNRKTIKRFIPWYRPTSATTRILDERGCIGAPDHIIQILSPGNTKREMQVNYGLYEENGIREYRIAHPGDHTMAVSQLKHGKYQSKKFYVKGNKMPCYLFRGLKIDTGKVFK